MCYSYKCMDALTRKTLIMLSLWTEVTDLNHSATQLLTFVDKQQLEVMVIVFNATLNNI